MLLLHVLFCFAVRLFPRVSYARSALPVAKVGGTHSTRRVMRGVALALTVILFAAAGIGPEPANVPGAASQMLRVAGEANVHEEMHSPTLINVGLPRSGTTTIHVVFLMLNVSSRHIVPGMTKQNIEEFRHGFQGKMKSAFTDPHFEVFGDRPCYGLIPQFRKYFPHTHLVASVRPRMHWLHSLFHNPSTGRDFLRDWAFPKNTVMAEALADHFNDTRWLSNTTSSDLKYVASTELEDFIKHNCSSWHGAYSKSCRAEMENLERVYITHRYLLKKHNVSIVWTESDNHAENCGVLTEHFPRGQSANVDQLADCCGTMHDWPVSNEGHDTMWSTPKRQQWLNAHGHWLEQQCSSSAARALRELVLGSEERSAG